MLRLVRGANATATLQSALYRQELMAAGGEYASVSTTQPGQIATNVFLSTTTPLGVEPPQGMLMSANVIPTHPTCVRC